MTGTNNLVARFAEVSEDALLASVDASIDSLKEQLLQVHRKVVKSVHAQGRLQETIGKDPGKFSIRKMATGSIDDFHKGLQDRIGIIALLKVFCLHITSHRSALASVLIFILNHSSFFRLTQFRLFEIHACRAYVACRQRLHVCLEQLQNQDSSAQRVAVCCRR